MGDQFEGVPVQPVLEKKGHVHKTLGEYLVGGGLVVDDGHGGLGVSQARLREEMGIPDPVPDQKTAEQREVEGQVRAAQRANERAQSYRRGEVKDVNGNRISVTQYIDGASTRAIDGAYGGSYAPPIRDTGSVGGGALAALVADNAKTKMASMLGPHGPVSVHGAVNTHTDLRAIGPRDRFDGMRVLVAGHTLWRYSASSTDLSSSVKIPMDEPASGRWLIIRDEAEARPKLAERPWRTETYPKASEDLRRLGEAFKFFDGEQVMRRVQRRQIEAILSEDARIFPVFARARQATVFAMLETLGPEPQEAEAVVHANMPNLKGLGHTPGGVRVGKDGMLVFLAAQTKASENGLWRARRGAWDRPCAWLDRLVYEIEQARHLLVYLFDYEMCRGGGKRPSAQSAGYAEVLIGAHIQVYERMRAR